MQAANKDQQLLPARLVAAPSGGTQNSNAGMNPECAECGMLENDGINSMDFILFFSKKPFCPSMSMHMHTGTP